MPIYVDDYGLRRRLPGQRYEAVWSHLVCGPFDDIADLHAFAAELGLRREWFQGPPRHPWPRSHYDVTKTKRAEAVGLGAIEVTWKELGRRMLVARRAWAATEHLVCTRTTTGKPPSRADRIAVARGLYEATLAADTMTPQPGRTA